MPLVYQKAKTRWTEKDDDLNALEGDLTSSLSLLKKVPAEVKLIRNALSLMSL